MFERRRYVRFKASILLKFQSGFAAGAQGVVTDISMAGAQIALDKAVALAGDCIIHCNLLLPSQTLSFYGKTVWYRLGEDCARVGVYFAVIADSHKEDIYNYISKYFRQELVGKWWQA